MSRPTFVALSIGDRIGPYEVVGTLGAGGMGEVYRARDTALNRDVALKVLAAAFTDDPEEPVTDSDTSSDAPLVVILNVFDELKRLAPAKR